MTIDQATAAMFGVGIGIAVSAVVYIVGVVLITRRTR